MIYPPQPVPAEILGRLGEDGLDITIWVRPHRAWGWLKKLMFIHEGNAVIAVGLWQSFSVHSVHHMREEINDALECTEHVIDAGCLSSILETLELTTLAWRPLAKRQSFLSACHYGLRVDWAGVETERRWTGHELDADDPVSRLWQTVDQLVIEP